MTREEFDEELRSSRRRLKVWRMSQPAEPASLDELAQLEATLNLRLPPQYRTFLQTYGGGEFGYSVVYTVRPADEWYILDRNRQAGLLGSGFLAFSENFCGDFYAFRVLGDACEDSVFFLDHAQSYADSEVLEPDLFSHLARSALQPA